MRRSARIAFVVAIAVVACDPIPVSEKIPPPPLDTDLGGFFGESVVEGTVELGDDFSTVPCHGIDKPLDNDPRVLRGRVFAPHGEFAANWTFPFVTRAHAVVLPNDAAVANATIAFFDRPGANPRATTTSDALGRWCLNVSRLSFGTDTLIVATKNDTSIRRRTPVQENAIITPSTEAFARIVDGRALTFLQIVNLKTIAETSVMLLTKDLPKTGSLEESVSASMTIMKNDARLQSLLR